MPDLGFLCRAISLDDTGDYVDWTFDARSGGVSKMTLGTFFAQDHPHGEPLVDFVAGRRPVPAPPQPVPLGPSSLLGSLFSFQKSVSGDQIDALRASYQPSFTEGRVGLTERFC